MHNLSTLPGFMAAVMLPASAAAAAPEPLHTGQAVQVIIGLAIVLALIAVASWAARRMQIWRPQSEGHIRVIEGLAIGARDKLVLVEVDGQRVLIGVSPGRMQALSTLAGEPPADDFGTTLKQNLPSRATGAAAPLADPA